ALLGVGALLVGSPVLVALVAASYALFSAFVVRALRAGTPISSCGCFGKIDTPPSRVHVAVDTLLAVAGAAVAISGTDVSLPAVLPEQPLVGVPFVMLVVIGAGLVFLAFTSLPRTLAAVQEMG
ncbi:MAG TPA: MauE/DoxX family redox-associated membrane protein, partial [Acidimicrobiia bacterium]|nr:MauE/DoxX family redox-associated membrane protein [Acidimicrobiia bacterium]